MKARRPLSVTLICQQYLRVDLSTKYRINVAKEQNNKHANKTISNHIKQDILYR